MSEVSISVNATNALAQLNQLTKNAEDSPKIVEELSMEMAENIVIIAKGIVPVDKGTLQESIHYEGAYPRFTFIADAKDKYGFAYGIVVEMGSSKQEPQPFMEPAINEGVRDAKTIIKQEIMRYLRSS
jgi:HK97 gp10 family phage protein